MIRCSTNNSGETGVLREYREAPGRINRKSKIRMINGIKIPTSQRRIGLISSHFLTPFSTQEFALSDVKNMTLNDQAELKFQYLLGNNCCTAGAIYTLPKGVCLRGDWRCSRSDPSKNAKLKNLIPLGYRNTRPGIYQGHRAAAQTTTRRNE